MRELFLHKLFEQPQGSGTSQQNSRDIPDSSLPNPRKTNFRGRARTFRPPPLSRGRPSPHPMVSGPTKLIFVLSFPCPMRSRLVALRLVYGAATAEEAVAHAKPAVPSLSSKDPLALAKTSGPLGFHSRGCLQLPGLLGHHSHPT